MWFHFIRLKQFHQTDKKYYPTINLQCHLYSAMQCAFLCVSVFACVWPPVKNVSKPHTRNTPMFPMGMTLPILPTYLPFSKSALVQSSSVFSFAYRMSSIQCWSPILLSVSCPLAGLGTSRQQSPISLGLLCMCWEAFFIFNISNNNYKLQLVFPCVKPYFKIPWFPLTGEVFLIFQVFQS